MPADKLTHLVIGLGEVGKAMQQVLDCEGYDIANGGEPPAGSFDILDICFGWTEHFHDLVAEYKRIYKPKFTVIHSTVPVGTCDNLAANHSPVRGKHPDLAPSIITFTKYLGGPDFEILAVEYAFYGIQTHGVASARDVEALKLWETTKFAVSVMLEKEIHEYCERMDLNFDLVYTHASKTYNEGYEAMGLGHFKAPIITHTEGKIGGHCVIPNCYLLGSKSAKRIISLNNKL